MIDTYAMQLLLKRWIPCNNDDLSFQVSVHRPVTYHHTQLQDYKGLRAQSSKKFRKTTIASNATLWSQQMSYGLQVRFSTVTKA